MRFHSASVTGMTDNLEMPDEREILERAVGLDLRQRHRPRAVS